MITNINEWKKLNERKERKFYTYNWSTFEATISGPDRRGSYHWIVEEENEAIPSFTESDWAELETFEEAEKDMFNEINSRIGYLPDSKVNESLSNDKKRLKLYENFTRKEQIDYLIKKLEKEFVGKFTISGNDVYCYDELIYTFKDNATVLSIFGNIMKLDDETDGKIMNIIKKHKSVKESLSNDRKREARLKLLIQEAKDLLEAKDKLKEIQDLKKSKNAEVQEALEDIEETSIIAKGVLFEVIKPYERKGLNTKEYVNFVENSVSDITKKYREIHNLAINLAKSDKKGYSYFRTAKNKDGKEGIVESVFDKFKNWISKIVSSIKNKISSFKNVLFDISNDAKKFQTITESVEYTGRRSKYKDFILEILEHNAQVPYNDFLELYAEKTGHYVGMSEQSMYRNLIQLLDQNVITRVKIGRAYQYSLNKENIDNKNVKPDNDPIITVLEKAKNAIDASENEEYYKELIKSKEEKIKELLKEFDATKVAIGDKILSLVTIEDKTYTDWKKYEYIMTNAQIVDDNVKSMAKSLFKMHERISNVKGSIRQYDNDSDLPDGTTGARFDYDNKKVVKEGVGDFFKRLGKGFMKLMKNFFKFSTRAKTALSNI